MSTTIPTQVTKYLGSKDVVIPITYCDNEVVFTDREVMTYMVVEGAPIGVPKREELIGHIEKVTKALEGTTDYDCQIYLATRAFDTEKWLRTVLEKQAKESQVTGITPAPAFHRYMVGAAIAMASRGYKQYTRYLGISLGKRKTSASVLGDPGQSFFKKAWASATSSLTSATKTHDPVPSVEEVRYWTEKARKIRSKLASSKTLNARGATARDMYEFMWHLSTLGMNVPPPPHAPKGTWGALELSQMDVGLNNENSTHMELSVVNPHLLAEYRTYEQQLEAYEQASNQDILEPPVKPELELKGSFVALSVKLPEEVGFPWLFQSTTGDQSVDASIRFRVKSKKEAKDEASKAVISYEKELAHQQQSGIYGGTDETNKHYNQARAHSHAMNTGAAPTQAEYTIRFFVHSPDPYQTQKDAQEFVTTFEEDLGTKLEWIKDSHGTFYLEAIPGSTTRSDVHKEKGDLAVLVNGMPFATRHMGHMNDGFYMGSYGQVPFLYDLAAVARQGKAPTCVCHGSLGGGKTVCVMQYVDTFRLRGYTIIVIDPKGDFNSHFALPGRGHARLWKLDKDGRPGMLDPFILISKDIDPDDPERNTAAKALERWKESAKELVTDTIYRALAEELNADQKAILASLIDAEMETPEPSMQSLMGRMRRGEIGTIVEDTNLTDEGIINRYKALAHNMYSMLNSAAKTSRGRLIFGERTDKSNIMVQGVPTTIINVAGLDLPQDGAAPEGHSQRISTAIFSLLCAYSVRLLKNPKIKGSKLLVVDEANVVKGMPAFKTMTADVNSQARSLGITPIYIDQSSATSTKDASAFSNKVGTRIVFRSSLAERENITAEMGYKGYDAQTLTETIPDENAAPGMALHTTPSDKNSIYPDYPGVGVVRFDRNWNPEYVDAFETNDEMTGFVRAAYRTYPFDAQGILHDPESPALTQLTTLDEPAPAPAPVLVGAGVDGGVLPQEGGATLASTAPVAPTSAASSAVQAPPAAPAAPAAPVAPEPVLTPAAAPASVEDLEDGGLF